MYIEHWSREEIEEYCENPNMLISKVNELRSRAIRELITNTFQRITSKLKQLLKINEISAIAPAIPVWGFFISTQFCLPSHPKSSPQDRTRTGLRDQLCRIPEKPSTPVHNPKNSPFCAPFFTQRITTMIKRFPFIQRKISAIPHTISSAPVCALEPSLKTTVYCAVEPSEFV